MGEVANARVHRHRHPPATDTRLERERSREAEAAWRAQREELGQRLEAARLEGAAALVAQGEEAAAAARGLQVRAPRARAGSGAAPSRPGCCRLSGRRLPPPARSPSAVC